MLAIHDVIRLIPNDVSTLAMGMAASAGQFLLSAGTRLHGVLGELTVTTDGVGAPQQA